MYLYITFLFPIFWAILQCCINYKKTIWKTLVIIGPLIFLILNLILFYYLQNTDQVLFWNLWTPSLKLSLCIKITFWNIIFMIFVAFLWMLNNIYSIAYLKIKYPNHNYHKFFFFIGIAIFCTTLTAFSENVMTMFLGYELLTLSTIPLIIFSNTEQSKKSANLYLNVLMFASIFCLLPAVLIINDWENFANLSPILQNILPFLVIFGVAKVAVFPLHFWLPRAMVAPTPVSAMFHAVAVVKIGIFCLLKMFFIFSNLYLRVGIYSQYLHYIAGFSALYVSYMAFKQNNLKAILAYSTLAQLSYMIMVITMFQYVTSYIMIHIIAHGIAKIGLFFTVGAFSAQNQVFKLEQINGISKKMPITFVCFVICSLSIVGIPPFFGAFSKFLLIKAVQSSIFAVIIFIICTILNSCYLGRVIFYAYNEKYKITKQNEAPLMMLLPMTICSISMLIFGLVSFFYIS